MPLPPPATSGSLRAPDARARGNVVEVARVFLRIGATTFGGPAAHVAVMEDELVRRRVWLSQQAFVDLVGITSLLPGPNSTELAMAIGAHRAGRAGLVVAGLCFIAPAALLVWCLAMAYAGIAGSNQLAEWRPALATVLRALQVGVLAVILQATWRLATTALRGEVTRIIALVALAASLAGRHELAVLAVAALAGAGATLLQRDVRSLVAFVPGSLAYAPHAPSASAGAWSMLAQAGAAVAAAPVTLPALFFSFLRIGALLFGSGYVLFAFLRREFVERLAWITEAQLLDAIAIGQLTPGPLFTSATFVGYLAAGHAGALLATLGIFAPAFLLAGLANPFAAAVRRVPALRGALDGVNAAAFAIMLAAALLSARAVAATMATPGAGLLILCGAVALLLATRMSAGRMLLASAVVGILLAAR